MTTTTTSTAPGLSKATTISSLPTELLIRLLSFLPALDLLSAKRTDRRLHNVVTDSSYLQYLLRIEVNGVNDFLPPHSSITERLRLLRQHENSWNRLRYNKLTENSFIEIPVQRFYLLQDGYLIYRMPIGVGVDVMPYGYVDLHSTSPNGELHWVNVVFQQMQFPFPVKLEFAVDYNLVVAISQPHDRATVDVSFFEFTTGASHPLSSKQTVRLPSPLNPVPDVVGLDVEVLGDYVLIALTYDYTGCYVSLISWKTGATKVVRELFFRQITEWRKVPKVVAIDNNLIAIVEDNTNSIEICRLDLTSPDVRIKSVCFLELPPLKHNSFVSASRAEKEWVSTSKHRPRSESVRGCPFRSSKVSNIRFSLDYHILSEGVYTDYPYTMILSVADLLSGIDTSRRAVPWADWGPPRTRIFPSEIPSPSLVGPFWLTNYSPVTIRDYDRLRARCHSPMTESSSFIGTPVFSPSKAEGNQWVGGAVDTCLPFREFIIPNLHFNSSRQVVTDREWLVEISERIVPTRVTVYHVA